MPARRNAAAASAGAHHAVKHHDAHGHGHDPHDPHGHGGAHGAHHRENSREHHREGTGLSGGSKSGSDKGAKSGSDKGSKGHLKKSQATTLDDKGEGRKFPPPKEEGERPDDGSLAFGPATATAPLQKEFPRSETQDAAPAGGGGGVQMNVEQQQSEKTKGERMASAFMDKLRKSSADRQWNPLYGDTKIAAKICTHPFWEPVCLFVICFNGLWIGYSVDQEDPEAEKQPYHHRMVENFFCFYFSGEIIIRIAAYRHPLSFFFDPVQRAWNIFDFTLVVLLLGETWAMPMMYSGSQPDLPALSAMRLLRMLRMVRVLRMIPELAMMVRSLVAAIRSVSTTFILAVGIMYIFAIILTQWARTHEQKNECIPPTICIDHLYGSLARSFLTLMQIMCFDNCFEVIRATLNERIPYGLLLILFILIVAFTVLNMLIGVVCQIVAATSAGERDAQRKMRVEDLFRVLDEEDCGLISKKELQRNEHVLEELEKAGVDADILKTAQNILARANPSGADSSHLDLEELMEVVFKLLHVPQTQDILLVQSKLEKLEKVLQASGNSQATRAKQQMQAEAAFIFDEEEDHFDMDETTRVVLENNLWELESQVTNMLSHAMEATGRSSKTPAAPWDVELRRLDAAMCRLRVRLERCQEETGPVKRGGTDTNNESEVLSWKRLCGEVVQSISATSTLMAQAIRESEPDGMFRGSADALFKAAVASNRFPSQSAI